MRKLRLPLVGIALIFAASGCCWNGNLWPFCCSKYYGGYPGTYMGPAPGACPGVCPPNGVYGPGTPGTYTPSGAFYQGYDGISVPVSGPVAYPVLGVPQTASYAQPLWLPAY